MTRIPIADKALPQSALPVCGLTPLPIENPVGSEHQILLIKKTHLPSKLPTLQLSAVLKVTCQRRMTRYEILLFKYRQHTPGEDIGREGVGVGNLSQGVAKDLPKESRRQQPLHIGADASGCGEVNRQPLAHRRTGNRDDLRFKCFAEGGLEIAPKCFGQILQTIGVVQMQHRLPLSSAT